jgi:hypothetical protein
MTNESSFKITVALQGKETNLEILPHPDKDHIVYEVSSDSLTCVVGINEHGEWESNCDLDENIVSSIGDAIEKEEENMNQVN